MNENNQSRNLVNKYAVIGLLYKTLSDIRGEMSDEEIEQDEALSASEEVVEGLICKMEKMLSISYAIMENRRKPLDNSDRRVILDFTGIQKQIESWADRAKSEDEKFAYDRVLMLVKPRIYDVSYCGPTNGDVFRSMPDHELAEAIMSYKLENMTLHCEDCRFDSCEECLEDWLSRPAMIDPNTKSE